MTTQWRSHNNTLDMTGRFEVQMLDDRLTPSGTATDAFGRIRVSSGFSIFDSQHRYYENEKWSTSNTSSTANTSYEVNASSILMNVGTALNDEVVRETKKVFYYQPGKSLLVMNTFVLNPPKTGLRQRLGYFGANNGIYLEQSNTDVYIVKRSYVNDALVEEKVAQQNWNIDRFDGSQYSAIPAQYDVRSDGTEPIDLTKSQIFWMDIEWLGVGDVRTGFVVNGVPKVAHVFHHHNIEDKPYMTTACLPLRYEIKNIAETESPSSLRQICSTVISEGGYSPELGAPTYVAGRNIDQLYTLPLVGTFYNLVTIRLSANTPDSVVIPKLFSLLGDSNTNYQWRIIKNGTFGSSLSYTQHPDCNSVEVSTTNSTVTNGTVFNSGFIQTAGSIAFEELNLNEQLERDLDGTRSTYTVAITPGSANAKVAGQLQWLHII